MKIEVFKSHLTTAKRTDWGWRTKVNGRITAHATGYNRKSDAIRAAVNHGLQMHLLALGIVRLSPERTAYVKSNIRAAIKVIE